MSNTIIRPKDRTEWLKYRESGIGSSEVATIVGLNPWETPYQLWRRKVGLDAPKQENFAMKAGHYLEDAVSLFWQDETGQQVIKSSAGDWLIRDDERPYLQVSPDRTYWLADMPHSNENKGILECKTTQMTIDEDDIPKHWFVQVQYQLGVAGYQHGSLAWLTQGRNFGYKDLAFVPDFFAWLVEEVDKFWVDNIQAKQEPTALLRKRKPLWRRKSNSALAMRKLSVTMGKRWQLGKLPNRATSSTQRLSRRRTPTLPKSLLSRHRARDASS